MIRLWSLFLALYHGHRVSLFDVGWYSVKLFIFDGKHHSLLEPDLFQAAPSTPMSGVYVAPSHILALH